MSSRGGGGGGPPRESCPIDCKVYVGELGTNGTRQELEDAFRSYGPLRNVWVATNPPGFAFVMFEDSRDAKDACRALDGKMICGRRVRVEMSTGKTRHDGKGYGGRGGDRYGGGGGGGYGGGGHRGGPPSRGPPRREGYRDSRRDDFREEYSSRPRGRRYSSAN
ncbi:unnamed protein product [Medioppia subpectinata]|uniref:RRM domain-containing protein n=1 Tax=Medioppia subpectinata TaxID=1979941 RepID=A0A7R9KIV8_9ACAR|nr:unnamed protein product [Medioppia subpectinata]CAG2103144.1 unnamed protein product [Medioppia subpectinata]